MGSNLSGNVSDDHKMVVLSDHHQLPQFPQPVVSDSISTFKSWDPNTPASDEGACFGPPVENGGEASSPRSDRYFLVINTAAEIGTDDNGPTELVHIVCPLSTTYRCWQCMHSQASCYPWSTDTAKCLRPLTACSSSWCTHFFTRSHASGAWTKPKGAHGS